MKFRAAALLSMLAISMFGCAPAAPTDDARVAVDDPSLAPRELLNPDTEVRLDPTVTNQTNRPSSHITPLVNAQWRETLESQQGVDVDEGSEPTTKYAGYYLHTTVKPFLYTRSSVKAEINVAVFTYPGLTLIGSMQKSATTPATGVDPAKEDLVLKAAVQSAANTFLQTWAN